MTTRTAETSPLVYARIAGFGLLIMAIVTPFSYFFVFQRLIVPGDAATTADNIMANELLFRMASAGWLIALISDVVVAWALYVLLKPGSKSLSLLMAWGRLVYTTIKGTTLLIVFIVLELLSGADYLTVFEADQLHALVLPLFNGYSNGASIAGVFLGFHLFVLGYLVFKSGYIPKILGVLVIIASLGYLVVNFGNLLFPDYEAILLRVFTLPNALGEMLFMLWLLIKGVNVQQWEKRALESA